MKYFLPDSQDLVDPSFDFETERRAADRLRHRDDEYAHQVFSTPAYDGLLVSKGIVDGFGPGSTRYSLAQRHRLLRVGVHEFFRLGQDGKAPLPVMGDCGAFTYLREEVPPYSVDQVLEFYVECRFDMGVSLDHVILQYQPEWDEDAEALVPADIRERQEITLTCADEFLRKHRERHLTLIPLGAAQGWSPKSYAHSVAELQKMGYRYIAIGGMVPLKTPDILASLEAINAVRDPNTRLHLLGVTRIDALPKFVNMGVSSFDSTAPLRQAFKDKKNNYYTMDGAFTAVRIPQVEGNAALQKRIKAGQVKQETARRLEKACLAGMAAYEKGQVELDGLVAILREYEDLYAPGDDHGAAYREVLEARPWRECTCNVCRALGHHVILFRGAERNRRRGFHNTWVFYRRLQVQVAASPQNGRKPAKPQTRLQGATAR